MAADRPMGVDTAPMGVDIAIVGGGMVGLTLAHLLAKALPELSVCIIEKRPLKEADASALPSFDSRSSALSPGSASVLESLGVWREIRQAVTAIRSVHVSDRGHFGRAEYNENNAPLGYVVANDQLGAALTAHLPFTNISPAEALNIRFKAASAILEVGCAGDGDSGQQGLSIEAGLVVIADGAHSSLRERLGIHVERYDYQQHAVIANLLFEKSHLGRAFEQFTNQGPMAVLPTGGSESARQGALVWTRPTNQIADTLDMDDQSFIAAVQARFGYKLGNIIKVGSRAHYPLERLIAQEQVRSNVVLLGNAAHFLHPVAGQGFNLALRDTMQLVETLVDATVKGQPIGSLSVLQGYLAKQERDQHTTTAISHGFNRIFGSSNRAVQVTRNLGLLSLDIMRAPKQEFFHLMMGRGQRQVQLDFMREILHENNGM